MAEEIVSTGVTEPLPGKRSGARWVRWCAVGLVGTLLAVLTFVGLFLWTLHRSENSQFLREQLIGALQAGLGPDHRIELGRAQLQMSGIRPVFRIEALHVSEPAAGAKATLDMAEFELPIESLWRLQPRTSSVRFEGLRIALAPASGNPAEAVAEAKMMLQSTIGVMHSLFAIAGRETDLRAVAGKGIDLFRRDEAGAEVALARGLGIRLDREDDRIELTLERAGRQEQASIVVTGVGGAADHANPIRIRAGRLTAGTFVALFGQPLPGISADFALDVEGSVAGGEVRTTLRAGPGVIDRRDWGMIGERIDEVRLELVIPEPGKGIDVAVLEMKADDFRLAATGRIMANDAGALEVSLSASEAVAGRLTPKEELVSLSRFDLVAELARDGQTLIVRSLDFADGPATGRFEGAFSSADGGLIATKIDARGFKVRRALRIWPATVAPELRDWLIKHVEGGNLASLALSSRLQGQALKDAFAQKPVPDDSLLAEYRLDDLVVRPIADAPPVGEAIITGRSSGRRATVTLESGDVEVQQGRSIAIRNAIFEMRDLTQKPATMHLKLPFAGRVDSVIGLLATPTLRRIANPPTDLAIQDGTATGVAEGWLRLVDKPGLQDARIDSTAEIRGLRIDPLTKGERLEAANLQLIARDGALTIEGEGRVTGVPAKLELRAQRGEAPEVTVAMVLDEAARARRGLDLRPVLTGPTPVTLSITLEPRLPPEVQVEIDLQRAKVEGIVPGFLKRPGQPAKVSFELDTKDSSKQVLKDFDLDLGSIGAKGRLELGSDGQLNRAELTQLRLSPGDNARASIERQRNGLKLAIRGNSFDMRPFLRGFQSGRIDDQRGTDLELDLQTTVLVGFNSEILAGADVQAVRRGGNLTRLQVRGRFGAQAVTVDTAGQRGEGVALSIIAGDAGALVRFLDLYPRAYGGRMVAEIIVGSTSQRGQVQAWDFAIRGEQFLRQYAGGGAGQAGPMSQGQPNLRGDSVPFQKMRAEFVRRPGRIDFNEAVMWGPQVGGNIEGYLDYGGDRVDLKGVLVPAYALNNLFAQLPLVGPIFGGSQYEGLFALPFVITGRASQPLLRTNTLSVIAPGFLRKMFELRREDGPQGGNTVAPAAPSSPAR
jgi:hypothetical protein